jgi:hypothetical protein
MTAPIPLVTNCTHFFEGRYMKSQTIRTRFTYTLLVSSLSFASNLIHLSICVLSLNYRISKAISKNFYKEKGKKTVRQWYQIPPPPHTHTQYIHPLSIAMQLPQVISVNVTGPGVTDRADWDEGWRHIAVSIMRPLTGANF